MIKKILFILILFNYDTCYSQELIPIQIDSLWGFCSNNKEIIIPAIYKKVNPFIYGYAHVKKDSVWSIINKKNETVFKQYQKVDDFHEGIAKVYINSTTGFIDKEGKELFPLEPNIDFSAIRWERLWYKENGKFGLMDIKGAKLTIPKYDSYITYGERGFYVVTLNNKKGVINENGKEIIPLIYNHIGQGFYNNLCNVERDSMFGFVNRQGKEVIALNFEFVWTFEDGISVAKKHGKYGLIDTLGNTVVPFLYNDAMDWCQMNRLGVKKKNKWGFIDRYNNIKIPFKYGYVNNFEPNGLSICSTKGIRYSLIDTNGVKITKSKYIGIQGIYNTDLFIVRLKDKYGVINNFGDILIPIKYEEINQIGEGCIRVKYSGKYGFFDKSGKKIIDFKYDYASDFKDGLSDVWFENCEFYINKDGFEFKY